MQTTSILRKCLAVGIILLFIGVAVAPSINSNVAKASNDNGLVEVTSQACGIQGFGNTTVKLTTQQYQDLEQYLVDFRARLNQTTTREEAVPIFKDAVVELNKYGLLPKRMSVEQAQELVTSQYQAKHVDGFLAKVAHNRLLRLENDCNFFCLIAGYTIHSMVVGMPTWTLFLSALLSFSFLYHIASPNPWFPGAILLEIFLSMLTLISVVLDIGSLPLTYFPVKLLGMILVGTAGWPWYGVPETGWITTFGLNGVVNYFYDKMYGQFPFSVGVVGFIGITLQLGGLPVNSAFSSIFLGGALAVNIGPNPPST